MKVSEFSNIDELIDIINERDKPLALYYFGKVISNPNKDKIEKYTSSGMLVVNDVVL